MRNSPRKLPAQTQRADSRLPKRLAGSDRASASKAEMGSKGKWLPSKPTTFMAMLPFLRAQNKELATPITRFHQGLAKFIHQQRHLTSSLQQPNKHNDPTKASNAQTATASDRHRHKQQTTTSNDTTNDPEATNHILESSETKQNYQ